MDFLSIRRKARERAKATEGEASGGARAEEPPGGSEPTLPAPEPSPAPPGDSWQHPAAEAPESGGPAHHRRERAEETVLTERDVAEGALQARLRELAPAADARFATWRPGAGPPPVEPDPGVLEPPPSRQPPPEAGPAPAVPSEPGPGRAAGAQAPDGREPEDPLATFFYRPDEEAGLVPSLGVAADEEPAAPAPAVLVEFLTFVVGTEEFAIPIERVREVMRAPAITEVPRAPANVLGIVTVRGEVVVILDARARLGLGGAAEGGRIVIVDAGEGPLGLLVDAVASVVRLPVGSIEPCPQGVTVAASDCVTGIGRWRDRLFMVIDATMLLSRARPAEER